MYLLFILPLTFPIFPLLGDRFWFENGGLVSSMTIDQLNEVRKASLARVLCDNLDDVDDLQPNIFRPPTNDSRYGAAH